jgi:AcrR family transcriptional regulator
MPALSLSEARSELVRTRVLEGVAAVLSRQEALTFANVAAAAGVPERTVYRHFPSRDALLGAVFDWANARIGFSGKHVASESELVELVRRVFRGFDDISPVVLELLSAPEGRAARLANKEARQDAFVALVRREAEGLDRATTKRVAAALQLLSTASAWQALHDYWDMDGAEAAEASALAASLMLEGARARARKKRKRASTKGR